MMAPNHIEEIRAALESLNTAKKEGKGWRSRFPPPDQHALEQSGCWLAPELLEMLMATVRIGLDGQEVVDLAVLSPELYEQGELWWPLDQLRNDSCPQRRADD